MDVLRCMEMTKRARMGVYSRSGRSVLRHGNTDAAEQMHDKERIICEITQHSKST
jgi:hypothetical protein